MHVCVIYITNMNVNKNTYSPYLKETVIFKTRISVAVVIIRDPNKLLTYI